MSTARTGINALMDRAASGDDGAFGALASEVQDELFRLALANGLAREDAAEVTQEALMRAYARRPAWKSGSDALAWLCGIALNVIREYHRRRRRRPTVAWDCNSADVADRAGAAGGEPFDPDQLRHLRQAVAGLPPRQREAIACRYLRHMSIRQTARAMGCAEGTVKSAVSAALERLREILQEHR